MNQLNIRKILTLKRLLRMNKVLTSQVTMGLAAEDVENSLITRIKVLILNLKEKKDICSMINFAKNND